MTVAGGVDSISFSNSILGLVGVRNVRLKQPNTKKFLYSQRVFPSGTCAVEYHGLAVYEVPVGNVERWWDGLSRQESVWSLSWTLTQRRAGFSMQSVVI